MRFVFLYIFSLLLIFSPASIALAQEEILAAETATESVIPDEATPEEIESAIPDIGQEPTPEPIVQPEAIEPAKDQAASGLYNKKIEETADEEIPYPFIHESKVFAQYCYGEVNMRRYYNCECLAARFLDQRIKMGPEAQRTSILSNIERECQDASEAAAHQYQVCLGNKLLLPSSIDPDQYCNCYAVKFAEIFEKNKLTPNPQTNSKAQSAAHVECRKPGVAAALYEKNQAPGAGASAEAEAR